MADADCLPDGPHFSQTFYNTVGAVIGNVAGLLGVYMFSRVFSKQSYRVTLIITTLVQVFASVFDVILNDRGGLLPGGPACPRTWYIHPGKPPHISQMAWSAVSEGTRAVHRRWLYELRALPADLLSRRNLAAAVVEFVRRIAVTRQWKWSTTAKALASVSGALQQLPLYTNQREPIHLNRYPEWQKTVAAAQRFDRESVAAPPSPITQEQKDAAQRNSLRQRDQEASLFLEMMWAFAARAGDLRTLQCRDVRFTGEEPPPFVDGGVTIWPDRYGVVLTMRRGKGARFRGPYSVPSTLPRESALILAHLLRSRRPTQHLFARPTEITDTIRTALRRENPLAALPSVRKGALRCMAANGMAEHELMIMSGHRRADTLHRYLGYGHQLTTEAATAQANASAALYELNSSA
ncbi:TATE DNA Transposon [Leptomonas pyrrhocoris]|uniref:TATE DNA Transposon n=1 Tax=Leptomonas pyrrhocoris TaxID=157538 RepID=A0A0M9G9F6_LEPPY|nr:TATE DNA Transposon [Leptomonas pyrrhocoris]KPA85309.1 TATE DNA Transposon [Leptomonas pyrrhocoris]|eukprot:XP_015663748.1 TATE DNA Transposon [Leptomonas pyrrhocoris]